MPRVRTFGAVLIALVCITGSALAQQQPTRPQTPPLPAVLRDYRLVTSERLRNPEPENWLMIRRTYDGWGYSPLDQVTPDNVQRLRPVWVFSTGETKPHEAPPIVNGGVMFVATPNNQVIAIDARSGNLLWRYRKPRPDRAIVGHETSRGVATLSRQGLLRRRRSRAGGAECSHWPAGLDHIGGGQQICLLHHARSAGSQRQGHGGSVRRRVGNPRIYRSVRF